MNPEIRLSPDVLIIRSGSLSIYSSFAKDSSLTSSGFTPFAASFLIASMISARPE